ncbi:inorganic diphosphatase [Arthrobacter sp. ISL-72]|nr:inorganic diphosphatase [Arthrobacter sp. ISL-72]MBT2596415.1 inorganic diphosphatase [Arthrobacter sp. ISL-72]
MTDYNALLGCGDYLNGLVVGVIAIPMGSSHKIEWDRTTGLFHLDRVDLGIFAKPVNYGFLPQTLDEDGDELDILCVTREPLPIGLVVHARILGVLNFRDGDTIRSSPSRQMTARPGTGSARSKTSAPGGRNRSPTTSTTTKTSSPEHTPASLGGGRRRKRPQLLANAANAGRTKRPARTHEHPSCHERRPTLPFTTSAGGDIIGMLTIAIGALAGSLLRVLLQRALAGATGPRTEWVAESALALVLGLITGVVLATGSGPSSAPLAMGAAAGLTTYAGTAFAMSWLRQERPDRAPVVPAAHLLLSLAFSLAGAGAGAAAWLA